jgi:predicted Zn-dependent peptidase
LVSEKLERGIFISEQHLNQPQLQQHQHQSGLTLLGEFLPASSVSFEFRIPCGSSGDTVPGQAFALENWLYKGAGAYSARGWAAALDSLGAQRIGGVGLESTRLGATVLPEDVGAALELYADLILRPQLNAADLTPILELARQDLESLEESPADLLFSELRLRSFSSPHRYATQGTLESLEVLGGALGPDGVRLARERYTPKGAIFSIAGNFDWDEVVATLERLFADWQGSSVAQIPAVANPPFSDHLEQDSHQTHLALQYRGEHPHSPDWYTFSVLVSMLSGGSSSRLFQEVREKRGLAYNVAASSQRIGQLGVLWVYAGTTPERAAETLAVLRLEVEQLASNLEQNIFGQAELERAKMGLLSSLLQSNESPRSRVSALSQDFAVLGRVRPISEIEAALHRVSLEDLQNYLARDPLGQPSQLTLGVNNV